jgi:hypothetical protein
MLAQEGKWPRNTSGEYVVGGLAKVNHQVRTFMEDGLRTWDLYKIDGSTGLTHSIHPTLLQLTGYSGDSSSDAYLTALREKGGFFDEDGDLISVDTEPGTTDLYEERVGAVCFDGLRPTSYHGDNVYVSGWRM